jgi:carboxymethylenebutenolidase
MTLPEIDPTQATSERLGRRAFVGISAAATAMASTGRVYAESMLGRPHPPLVAQDDPAISTAHVELQSGISLTAYAAWPVHSSAGTPSVVVVMHVWGIDTSIRDVVRRYAKAGFAAIAPDLYARSHAPSGDGSSDVSIFRPYANRLVRQEYVGDLRAAADWCSAKFPAGKTAINGFCMGGRMALLTVSDTGDRFASAAPFYGPLDGVDPHKIGAPVCGSYGARDASIPADRVRAFFAALSEPNELRIYDDAGHAFFDDQRRAYVASASADAWTRTLAWFAKYVGEPSA